MAPNKHLLPFVAIKMDSRIVWSPRLFLQIPKDLKKCARKNLNCKVVWKFLSRLKTLHFLFAKRQLFTSDFCVIIRRTLKQFQNMENRQFRMFIAMNIVSSVVRPPFVSADTHGLRDIYKSKIWTRKTFQIFFAHFKSNLHVFKKAAFGTFCMKIASEIRKFALLKTWRFDLKCAKKIWNVFRIQILLFHMFLSPWVSAETNGVAVRCVK